MGVRTLIVEEARSWIGVRWRHQGRSRELGVDCSGLIAVVAHKLKLVEYDYVRYSREAQTWNMADHLRKAGMVEKPFMQMDSGDVIIMSRTDLPYHCGIVDMLDSEHKLIHSFLGGKREVTSEPLARWRAYMILCLQFPNIQ